jgi:arginyl-tRNA synthetase
VAEEAVAWHGVDAVRYVLARTPEPRRGAIERQLELPLDLDNPFAAVRYAHAHAASTARWAAGLADKSPEETGSGERAGSAERTSDEELANKEERVADDEQDAHAEPAELALLDLLSWRDERLASAARRRRPAELCSYLEQVAGAYLHCARECPALPFGGAAAPDPAGPQAAARLELAAATHAVLAAGLRVAGVSCPGWMFEI